MDDSIVIRRATVSDADLLSKLCQRTFRETFVEDFSIPYPENDLEYFLHSTMSRESFEKKLGDDRCATWLMEDQKNGQYMGYAVIGPCYDRPHQDVCVGEDAQLNRFYIQRDYQNRGLGKRLMNIVLPWFDEHFPQRPIWLSVWSNNLKAHQFYAHYGFERVGEYGYPIGQWTDRVFAFMRPGGLS